MTDLVIVCVPAYNAANVAYAKSLMKNPRQKMHWLKPYPGSLPVQCERHGGDVWIGPAQQQAIKTLAARGVYPPIMCHFCAVVSSDGLDVYRTLSDQETGTFEA